MSTQKLVVGLPKLNPACCYCPPCVCGKQHRQALPKAAVRVTSRPLQLVHSDLCRPMPVESLSKSRFFLTFIDDYSRHCWIYFLAAKGEAFSRFKHFKSTNKNLLQCQLGQLQSDRSGEYLSTEFTHYLDQHGHTRQLTAARTPEQNGVAERKNHTLIEAVRSMANENAVTAFLWEEFFRAATYLQNGTVTRSLTRSTPYRQLFKRVPNVQDF
jgi:transposase InsO family protein